MTVGGKQVMNHNRITLVKMISLNKCKKAKKDNASSFAELTQQQFHSDVDFRVQFRTFYFFWQLFGGQIFHSIFVHQLWFGGLSTNTGMVARGQTLLPTHQPCFT